MKEHKNYSDLFDDDFEVTFEEYEEDSGIFQQDGYDEEKNWTKRNTFSAFDIDADETDRNLYDREFDRKDPGHRRKRRSGVPLAAPIRKGGRVLSRIAQAVIRSLTALLILAVSVYASWNFYRASTPYGDIAEALRTQKLSMCLAAYLCIVALFLLFEFISLLWSLTKVRFRDGRNSWKEDTGRGLFSFIAVFAFSYLAFLFSRFLPESPDVLYGLKGALDVYGSMHNVLFGLCAAGAVSCLIRRYL